MAKAATKAPAAKKVGPSGGTIAHYKVEGGKLVRARKFCPKCGPGTFLAEHSDRLSCGKCGYTEKRAGGTAPVQNAPAAKPKGKKK